jgi:hypothetical protein
MEYQPKTSWLKRQIAKKTNGVRDYNVAEAQMQEKQMKYLQRSPRFASLSSATQKVQEDIRADIKGYVHAKNKARGTQSSAERKVVK